MPSDKKKTVPFGEKPLPDQERLAMGAIQRWLDRLPSAKSRVRVIDYVAGLRREALEMATVEEQAEDEAALDRLRSVTKQTAIPGTVDA